ncbi:unnamed protein product [Prorocentrum cordatum]|uniref:Uncharacterized protein n=1 Tax=Prorocentrum cordatum TaxID=2364126 RepID=A0ABN9QEK3_9DINO|nr:unnamed protein product [Polarella glacialis]
MPAQCPAGRTVRAASGPCACRRAAGRARRGGQMDVGELHGADACGGGWRPGADVLQQEEWDGLVEEDPGSARQKATDPTPGGAPREIPKESAGGSQAPRRDGPAVSPPARVAGSQRDARR